MEVQQEGAFAFVAFASMDWGKRWLLNHDELSFSLVLHSTGGSFG